jgi:hypothetical protein
MKLRVSKEQGGALLVVLITSVIMGISLASFLQYTGTQSRSIHFSQSWNAGIPVAEAGVEEALAHINDSTIGTNFAINGWVRSGDYFVRTNFTPSGRYYAKISTNRWPILTVTSYVKTGRVTNEYARTVRVTTTQASTGMKGIVVKGNAVMNGITEVDSFDSEDERYATRGRYDAAKRKDGGYVASVLGNVTGTTVYGTVGTGPTGTATGNVGTFDWLGSNTGIQPGAYANDVNYSFPIAQAPYNMAPPLYRDEEYALTNFAFWSTMITTTNPPSTPPPSGVITNYFGTNTVLWPTYPPVSSLLVTTNWTLVTNQKLPGPPNGGVYKDEVKQSGSKYDYYLLTSYSYPAGTNYTYSLTATNYSMTTNTYQYVARGKRNATDTSGRETYYESELRMSGSDKMIVLAPNRVLYIPGDFVMTGSSEIIIAPGGSLKIYVGGDISLAGNGLFNYTLDASKLGIYGLPSCKNVAISGNASFTAVLYAPQADVVMNGSGVTTYDIVGAVVAKTATMNGHFQFHYDEALGRAKILAKYFPASWQEL